ncbi:MAG: histidine phosphatase family protein [Rhodospirillaceae bacterium]|jgi:broad specificity phosphatase PhoE|nr:histidine phosphatase family protein [Rhodospirillaceae bacterium]
MDQTLYLIRHGETEWNRAKKVQGWNDSPLTELGETQARGVAGILAREIADPAEAILYCSPLGRARATAEIIAAELGLDFGLCRFDDDLKELNTGQWDGLTFAEIEAAFPDDLNHFREDSWRNRPPGGESYAMLAARIGKWLDALEETSPVLVVSHGIAGQVFRGLYLGLGEAETVSQDQPQDVVFRLAGGRIAELTSQKP